MHGATGVCNAIDGRTGVGVFVPYYHGRQSCGNVTKHIFDPDEECPEFPGMTRNGGTRRNNTDFYSSMLLGVDLVTEPYIRVRIHNIITDFADYYTYDQSRDTLGIERRTGKLEKLYYQLGIGAYKGQLLVRDVAEDLGDASLRGFHGFVAARAATARATRRPTSSTRRPFVSHEELAHCIANDELCAAHVYGAEAGRALRPTPPTKTAATASWCRSSTARRTRGGSCGTRSRRRAPSSPRP